MNIRKRITRTFIENFDDGPCSYYAENDEHNYKNYIPLVDSR